MQNTTSQRIAGRGSIPLHSGIPPDATIGECGGSV